MLTGSLNHAQSVFLAAVHVVNVTDLTYRKSADPMEKYTNKGTRVASWQLPAKEIFLVSSEIKVSRRIPGLGFIL